MPFPPDAPPLVVLETEAGGILQYPSPKQASKAAQELGGESGNFIAFAVGQKGIAAALDRSGRYSLQYKDGADGPHYQALALPLDAIVDAFERFAAGDHSRSPLFRWSLLETRIGPALMGGGQRLPEDFYDIAPRLRRGDRPLDIRNDIMAASGQPKLVAWKRVEAVQKLIRQAKGALFGGLLSVALLIYYQFAGQYILFRLFGLVFFGIAALAQFAFAWYIWSESRPSD